jgi:collagen type III alpha
MSMATDLGRAKSAAAGRYDTFVAGQLARAERRVRALDLTAALLGFAAGTLAYAVVMVLVDRQFVLSLSARKAALFLYALGAAAYLWLAVLRPLRRRVNPYYAARQVERTLASAKNSLVNWVDLHDEPLPATIRGAVGQRAAKDLAQADLERAISGRRAGWAGGVAAVCFAAFLTAFFLLGGRQFFSFMGRAFAPFAFGGAVPTRTLITVVRPEGGDTTVTIGRSVTVVAEVTGKVPDPKGPEAVRLLYRYQDGAPYQERLLNQEAGAEWAATVAPIDVQNGFWYKVAGGDCETREFRVSVRSAPLITGFEAAYHYRPYVARVDEVRTERKIEALRGTEVTVLVRTNRTLKEARLDFEGTQSGPKSLAGERQADDARAFRVRLVLDEPGQYRVLFTSQDGETYADPKLYPVVVITDQPPKVELTKPGQDVRLAANGVLQLEGQATDDVGVKSVTLRAQLVGGPKLKAKPYRSDDKLRLPGGGYPLTLAYKDFVELGKVQSEDGSALTLRPGMELEYWLEAADACDYPKPNVAESKHYKVQIAEPEKDANKQRQEQQKAEQEQKQHEAKQDQELKQEDQARQEARKQEQERQKEEARQREQERQNQNGEGGDKKPDEGKGEKSEGGKGGQGDKSEGAKSEEGNGEKGQDQRPGGAKDGGQDSKPGEGGKAGEQPGEGQKGADEQTKRQADELQKALDKRDQQQGGEGGGQGAEKSESKPDGSQAGEAKGGGKDEGKQGEGQAGNGADQARGSEGKGEGQKDGAKDAGENKGGAGDKQGAAANKEGGGGDPMNRGAEGKGGGPMGQSGAEPGQARDKGPAGKQPERSAGKEGGTGEGAKGAAQEKSEGGSATERLAKKGDPKDAGSQGANRPADGQPQGASKDKPAAEPRADTKGAGPEAAGQQAKAAPKDGKQNPTDGSTQAEGKAAPEKRDGSDVARGGGKPDPKQQARDARPEDAQRLARAMKDRLEKSQGGQGSQGGQAGQKSLEEIARDLERMAKEARDPKAREAARQALEELREETAEARAKQGPGEPGKPGQPTGEPGGEAKPGNGNRGQGASEEKSPGTPMAGEPRGDNKGPGKGAEQGEGTTGQPMPPEAQNQNGTGQAKGKGNRPAGNQPGEGVPGTRPPGDPAAQPPDQGPRVENSKPLPSRASVEQLERFKNKVDKDVLKDLKMSEEDYRRFLKAYEEMVKHQEAEKPGADEGAVPGAPSALPSTGSRRVRPDAAKPGNDVGAGGRALPPPPYRDAYRKFTEKIATPDK